MNAVRPWLWVGKLAETLYAEPLQNAGIGAVLQLAHRVPYQDIAFRYLRVDDGQPLPSETLARGVAFVREQQVEGKTVLVACGRGVSRAATFATAVLKETEGLGLLEAFRHVNEARREARIHPVLWASLCAYYGEEVPFVEMLRACRPQPTPWR